MFRLSGKAKNKMNFDDDNLKITRFFCLSGFFTFNLYPDFKSEKP